MNSVPLFIRHIYFGRTAAFAYAFAVLAILVTQRDLGPLVLVPLALQFLVLPQVFYWYVRHAPDPRRTGLRQLHLDALLLGAWFAQFGFPDWAGFGLLLSTSLNGLVTRGVFGLGASLVLFAAGALGWGAVTGFRYEPAVSPAVMHLSVAGALIYAWFVGYVVYYNSRLLTAARHEIRASEERYRLIAENAGDLVAMVNAEGRWLYTSPSYGRLLAEGDLAEGGDCFAQVLPDDRPALADAIDKAARSGRSFALRVHLRARDGTSRLLDLAGHPASRPKPPGEGVVLVARDITELGRQEERLAVAAHAFDEMSEAMMIHTLAGEIIMVNHGFCELTGYPIEEVIGANEADFRNACQPPSFYDQMYSAVERDGRWTGTTWSRRKDGSLYREWRNVSAIRDDAGRIKHIVTMFFELDSRDTAQAAPVSHLTLRRR